MKNFLGYCCCYVATHALLLSPIFIIGACQMLTREQPSTTPVELPSMHPELKADYNDEEQSEDDMAEYEAEQAEESAPYGRFSY